MSEILDYISKTRYGFLTGTTAEAATVPANAAVESFSFAATSGGSATLVITPAGAGQKTTALPTITVGAGKSFDDPLVLLRLGAGTIFTFAGSVESYAIKIAYLGGV